MDIAERMQCPPDFIAAAAIVALGSVIGRRCGIRPKRHDDWTVVPNLWGAVIGRPGVLKSPAIQEALRPLHRLEAEAGEAHAAAMRAFEGERAARALERRAREEVAKRDFKKGAATREEIAEKLAALGDGDAEPMRARYIVNDSTVEKLGELLVANPTGLLLFRDELVAWLRSFDRDGHEGDRAFYLEAWNGNGRFTYDRIGRGTVEIPAACVSVLGAIQPGPLLAYLSRSAFAGAGDDGLLQRLQVVVWPDLAGGDSFLRDNEDLRGVLNSGHTQATAYVIRTVGEDHEPRRFGTWAPKAIALIGSLPATLADRSIDIRMQRKRPGDRVERFRDRRHGPALDVLCRKAARWAADHLAVLADADPDLPEALNDRAQTTGGR